MRSANFAILDYAIQLDTPPDGVLHKSRKPRYVSQEKLLVDRSAFEPHHIDSAKTRLTDGGELTAGEFPLPLSPSWTTVIFQELERSNTLS